MALVLADRVQVSTSTEGTGTLTLGAALDGFQDFSVIGNGNTTYYTITNGNNWEVGIGTYMASGTTLSRNIILDSSNGGNAINLFRTSNVFVTYPADKNINSDAVNTFTTNQIISASNTFAALRVTQTGSGNALIVEDSANPDSTPFVVTNDGSVGVNKLIPIAKLDVAGDVYLDNFNSGFITADNNISAWAGSHLWYDSDVVNGVGSQIAELTSNGFDVNGTVTANRFTGSVTTRTSSSATNTSVTPDTSLFDMIAFTALASALTINAPTGSPTDGTKLLFRILDNGTARALTWDGTYTPIGVTLPTTTVINKTIYVSCIYNANNTRWDVIAVTTQA